MRRRESEEGGGGREDWRDGERRKRENGSEGVEKEGQRENRDGGEER